jgi:ariadne-1
VPSELVKRLCSEAINAKFHGFLLDSFVNDSKTSVWCPQPGCGLAVDSATAAGQGKFVTCGQGHSFCLECKHEAHAPASCDCVKKWLQKCDDDSETFNWLAANTQVHAQRASPVWGEPLSIRQA